MQNTVVRAQHSRSCDQIVMQSQFLTSKHTAFQSLCPFCMTAMWKCLISRFAENRNKAQQNFTSLYEIGYGPLEFNIGWPTLDEVGRNNWDED